jgi:hypothetical protein
VRDLKAAPYRSWLALLLSVIWLGIASMISGVVPDRYARWIVITSVNLLPT